MIETTFLATSEKLWPGACKHLRRPAQLVGAEFGEESLDRGAALRRAQVAARGLAAFRSGR